MSAVKLNIRRPSLKTEPSKQTEAEPSFEAEHSNQKVNLNISSQPDLLEQLVDLIAVTVDLTRNSTIELLKNSLKHSNVDVAKTYTTIKVNKS